MQSLSPALQTYFSELPPSLPEATRSQTCADKDVHREETLPTPSKEEAKQPGLFASSSAYQPPTFKDLPLNVISEVISYLPTVDQQALHRCTEAENVQQVIALDRLSFLQKLSCNSEFRKHYYAMSGEEFPSSDSLSQMSQDRMCHQMREADSKVARNIDREINRILNSLNKTMRAHWSVIPTSIRSHSDIFPKIDLKNPEVIQEIFEEIYAYNLFVVGRALKIDYFTPPETRQDILKAAKDVIARLSDATRPITKLKIGSGSFSDLTISFLPIEITMLQDLENLTVVGCVGWRPDEIGPSLQFLPKEIGRLKKLKKLSVYFNKIKELPHTIGELESLEKLCIFHNKLKELPDEIARMKKLEIVY